MTRNSYIINNRLYKKPLGLGAGVPVYIYFGLWEDYASLTPKIKHGVPAVIIERTRDKCWKMKLEAETPEHWFYEYNNVNRSRFNTDIWVFHEEYLRIR